MHAKSIMQYVRGPIPTHTYTGMIPMQTQSL